MLEVRVLSPRLKRNLTAIFRETLSHKFESCPLHYFILRRGSSVGLEQKSGNDFCLWGCLVLTAITRWQDVYSAISLNEEKQ